MAFALTVIMTFCHITAHAEKMLSDRELDSIAALLPNMPENKKKVETLYYISRHYQVMDTIIKYSLETYFLAKRLGYSEYVASICSIIGWYYNTTGKFALAPKYFKEAEDIFIEKDDKINQAMMLSGCGDAYIGMGRFEQGVEYKMQALSLFDPKYDLASTALIYRTIGLSCNQFQQYKPAMEYLDKALKYDLEVQNARGTGRDYYYIGLTLMLSASNNGTSNNQLAKEYLLHALQLQEKINDKIFIIKTCGLIALIYNDMHIATQNWEYADSSYYYYKKGENISEQIRYYEENDIYQIARAEHTMLSGNYIKAMQTLQQKIEQTTLPSIPLHLLNHAAKQCFLYTQNYKGLFELTQRINRARNQVYISEFDIQFSKYNKRIEFENQIKSMEKYSDSRSQLFESTKIRLHIIVFVVGWFFIFIAAITYVFVRQHIKNKQYNIILQNQTAEIKATNEELNALLAESQLQSELITEQTMEMKRQRNKLASINLRIVINLDIASRFQTSLMPSQDTVNKIFKKTFVLWRPLEEVSGDFYWVTEVDGFKFIAVADCTGHGIPGASLSMLGISFLNSIVARIDLHNINAAEVLTKLRYRITESLTRGSVNNEDIHDGMDIAVCIFDTKNSKLSYAGAYRPLWIVNNGQLTEYKPDKIPIAVDKDRNSDFTNNEIHLQHGDRVYMFSDGITDQFGERENGKLSKFKPKRLRELLCNIYDLAPEQQMRKIETAIDQWRGDSEQTDDITVIGVMEA